VFSSNKTRLSLRGFCILSELVVMVVACGVLQLPIMRHSLFVRADAIVKYPKRWDRLHETFLPPTPFTPKDKIWEDLKLTSNTSGLKLALAVSDIPKNASFFPAKHHDIKFGETVNLDDVSFSLAAIGIAYRTSEQGEVPYQWFGPDFQTIPAPQDTPYTTGPLSHKSTKIDANLPNIYFHFNLKNGNYIKALDLNAYNTQTHKSLCWAKLENFQMRRGCSFQSDNEWLVKTEGGEIGGVYLWHSAPVEIISTIITSSSIKVAEFSPKIGEGFRDGNFDFRVGIIQEGMSWTGYHYSRGPIIRKDISPHPGVTTWGFLVQPQACPFLEVEFLDINGKVIKANSLECDVLLAHVETQGSLENVAKIRVKYSLQNGDIVSIHLPEIPGLPEENRHIEDLSAVHIPYAIFKSQGEARRYAGSLLNYNAIPSNGSGLDEKETLEFHDITVRELVETLAQKTDTKARLVNNDRLLLFEKPKTFQQQMQEWEDLCQKRWGRMCRLQNPFVPDPPEECED
jgi:hypothetical protein